MSTKRPNSPYTVQYITTTVSPRHKIAILRASDPAFDDLYRAKSKRTELPVDLAEVIIRLLFDGNAHVRLEFVPAAVV